MVLDYNMKERKNRSFRATRPPKANTMAALNSIISPRILNNVQERASGINRDQAAPPPKPTTTIRPHVTTRSQQ
ncbi:hypothetical protein IAQ61_006364 [Plenodomus lingam]|uniref:uncharacterized protein n=1 Tax=Leptosphaeria maculans TaxID=5022 RepID=UPI0033168657|nr:hypothetical protein IAQ61_006364 [Plenodomus lingam]